MDENRQKDLQQGHRHRFFNQPVPVDQSAPHDGKIPQHEREQKSPAAKQPEEGKADAVADRTDRVGRGGLRLVPGHQVEEHTNKQEHRERQHQARDDAVNRAPGRCLLQVDRLAFSLLPAAGRVLACIAGAALFLPCASGALASGCPLPGRPAAAGGRL